MVSSLCARLDVHGSRHDRSRPPRSATSTRTGTEPIAGDTSPWVALEPLTYPEHPDAGLAAPDRIAAPEGARLR